MKENIKKLAIVVLVTALATATGTVLLLKVTGKKAPASPAGEKSQAEQERKIIYWKAPMDPTEIYDEPGKSKMGMDLVPVYEDEVSGTQDTGKRKIVYWKAPMDPTEIYDEPGKSKMGMDLVPVYEDELKGGVDIKINPVVEQNMGLRVARVDKGMLNHTIRTYGHLTFDETRTGIVSEKAGGWIEKLYADYTGFVVEKGDPLYEIYSPSLLASQEEVLSAFKNYRRNKSPMNRDLLDSAKNRLLYYDIAPEEIGLIEKTGKVRKSLIVRSPYRGVVVSKDVIEGAYVKTGASLFTIADLSVIWVEAHIFEYEQNLVYEGQTVEMTLSYIPGKTYTGKIAYIFPYLQPKTRDVIIRVSFDNSDGELKPDMFARIRIDTAPGAEGLSIPSQAVIHSGEKKIVFVARGNGRFSPREITTGMFLDQDRVQVLSGLTQGENIVVSGQFLLDSESKLKEAIQKMIESKSKGPAKAGKTLETGGSDDFFDDMDAAPDAEDDFFKDME
ncbi:efflux RND transporter periplasmic adaptor subunit [Desulfospira joergensenii]|uniref:efflux RND transporter periplasmic adaptor subunit n=1 Tax=Desulfospira joergensenii TaxID=53329 RepID=UPI0003B55F6C|nr:efflux RND transporter periplasmic adaptor subunit [Desulfospira joergensenii]